ncbi:mRNA export factor mex67 [Apiospora aurea]|uniref:mRNA export factor mex67 n=1 Tax=Apiospora aurea TaxID=335848 RepID=A0ABR1QBF7_9PEZI
MAPTGPRNGAPRNNTRSAASGKSATRGGIAKRRAGGPIRVDRDGDLDMDAAAANAAGGRGKKSNPAPAGSTRKSTRTNASSSRPPRPTTKASHMVAKMIQGGTGSLHSRISQGIDPSSRHTRSSRPINGTNNKTLIVEGLQHSKARDNEGGGLKELLIFLERKATTAGKLSHSVRIKKSQLKGDLVYVTASKEDAEHIMKVNGFDWAGTKVHITEADDQAPNGAEASNLSAQTQDVKENLRTMLAQRYDPGQKLLNLASLGSDSLLIQMNMFQESTPQKLFRALMVICDEQFKTAQAKRDAISSVTLAGNNIDDVGQVMTLTETFPDLIHLDLSNNSIKELRGLRKWQHRLRKIETLLLINNPIDVSNPSYKDELVSWFPRLQNLSGTQVRTAEQVAAAELANKPTPIPQSGPDFRDINGVGEQFITDFIRGYDMDRPTLAAKYYDDYSHFSLSVNGRSSHPPDIPLPQWGSYIKFSRNHVKITTTHARQQRLFSGTAVIQSVWQKLPATRHPDLATQFDKYIIDCHPISGLADLSGQSMAGVDGMIITFHGEFEDQDPETKVTTKRSFSRTIILGPGAPGRNPIRVASDVLTLKAYNPLPPILGAAVANAAVPVAPQAPASAEEVQKQQMLAELCRQTGMNEEYSRMCLDVANWVFDQALATFHEKRASLPADAFTVAGPV